MKKNGFSLVELILVIVVAAIAVPALMFVFREASIKAVHDELSSTAVMLAEGELERVLAKSFSNITSENRDSPVSFGGNFSGYSWQIRVDTAPQELANDPLMLQYKQIEARVTNSVAGDISLTTVVTNN